MPVGQQSGVLVAFAAEPGKTASDIGQGSGPYAAALATELVKPGQSDLIMFHNVRVAVMDKTKGDQVPWTEDGIQRRQRVLFGGEGKPRPAPVSEATRAWARHKTSVASSKHWRRHGSSPEADYARARIELKKQVVRRQQAKEPHQGGMLRCEPTRAHRLRVGHRCSWADDWKQCQRKSGSLATALLEALPASKPAPEGPCAGVEALVGNEKRCLKPNDSFKDCPECPEMVVVPAGSFMMGSPASEGSARDRDNDEGPQHKVTIAKPFAVGKFEVTFAEWDACVAAGGCKHQPGDQGWGRGRRPVINVSWDDITKEYLPWLSRKTGKTYRLLTEAEWEYAARAGTTTPFSTGARSATDQANFDGNARPAAACDRRVPEQDGRGRLVPSQRLRPSRHARQRVGVGAGLLEGQTTTVRPTDGSAWTTGDCGQRVLRGGSWFDAPRVLRSANRDRAFRQRLHHIGFRLARTLNP